MKFTVVVDRRITYELEAPSSFEAWDKAFAAHPDADRVEVQLPPLNPRPTNLARLNDLQMVKLQAVVEPNVSTLWRDLTCGN